MWSTEATFRPRDPVKPTPPRPTRPRRISPRSAPSDRARPPAPTHARTHAGGPSARARARLAARLASKPAPEPPPAQRRCTPALRARPLCFAPAPLRTVPHVAAHSNAPAPVCRQCRDPPCRAPRIFAACAAHRGVQPRAPRRAPASARPASAPARRPPRNTCAVIEE
ncbi:predicted GPI-anchored protein 58 [Ananas comosus]|uniref:Predicted GPI-anchored protein 58 n=1 Tax=Ananas comosus TaxID=4615 RepID=A0A6P5FW64_ANACO|nr:predicted GPI-anchored protein 58 [Ananas comosus]